MDFSAIKLSRAELRIFTRAVSQNESTSARTRRCFGSPTRPRDAARSAIRSCSSRTTGDPWPGATTERFRSRASTRLHRRSPTATVLMDRSGGLGSPQRRHRPRSRIWRSVSPSPGLRAMRATGSAKCSRRAIAHGGPDLFGRGFDDEAVPEPKRAGIAQPIERERPGDQPRDGRRDRPGFAGPQRFAGARDRQRAEERDRGETDPIRTSLRS